MLFFLLYWQISIYIPLTTYKCKLITCGGGVIQQFSIR